MSKRRLTFLVLDFSFDIFNTVRGLNLKRDGFPRQCFDKNLGGELKKTNKLQTCILSGQEQESKIYKILG